MFVVLPQNIWITFTCKMYWNGRFYKKISLNRVYVHYLHFNKMVVAKTSVGNLQIDILFRILKDI